MNLVLPDYLKEPKLRIELPTYAIRVCKSPSDVIKLKLKYVI
jgi:hypothetical protein